jgi:hypothetical protein
MRSSPVVNPAMKSLLTALVIAALSVWQPGGGPAADSGGNVYVLVASGDFKAPSGGHDYSDSALKLQPSGRSFRVLDYFTPFNQQTLDDLDLDFALGSEVRLPDQPSSPNHLLLANNNKEGKLYLINREDMGKFDDGDDSQILQTLKLAGGILD